MPPRARWILVILGVSAATVAFVGIVVGHSSVERASPWWFVGLVGMAVTLAGLGSPRAERPEGHRGGLDRR